MTSTDHRRIATALGAYLLGALDEAERREVSDHLASCDACRQELANLAGLPARLGQLEARDVDELDAAEHPGRADAFVMAALRQQRRRRHETRAWQAVAAVAAAVALVGFLARPADDGGGGEPLAMVVPGGSGAVATAVAVERPWGTELRIEAQDLPAGDGYELWALNQAGERQLAGTWSTSPTGRYRVTGATGFDPDDLARIEIADVGSGTVIAAVTV